jgi:hypothetical protein
MRRRFWSSIGRNAIVVAALALALTMAAWFLRHQQVLGDLLPGWPWW